ncbi:TPR domain-containing glycosyltransferase [Cohnella candidum]|uniref:Glycosyltransferase n=1 Tax=Cohnella candidum TaxID=2674991 RepID=A0A3G3K129_9BACL|nr:TPR domain-containing glycosyltransferase [Cohnella candidum]AYQ74132.1 glycosyltransferase [Cohnella candidum]
MEKLLSLCMIVKNEEKVLARCLDSVQGYVDEIIVVDTGSSDSTKEIASRYTEHVYDFTWINDFAIAKNEAVRRATSKWILVLDADEYLDPDKKDELRGMLSELDASQPLGFVLPIFNLVESVNSGKFIESTAVRLFTNLPTVYFDRPIHEQVVYRDGELPLRNYPLSIFHTGYLEQTRKEKEKSSRNLSIFKDLKGMEEYDYFTLGNEYSSLKDYKQALYYYERALTKKTETMTIFPFVRYQIVLVLIELKRYRDAISYIDENLRRWPQYPDYYSIKASVLELLGFEEEAAALYQTALAKAEVPSAKDGRFWLIAPSLGSHIPLSNLASLSQKKHDYQQAVYYLSKLVNVNLHDHLVLFKLLNILIPSEPTESILAYLGKIFDFGRSDHLMKLLHVSLLLGHKELAGYFHDECSKRNVELLPAQQLFYAVLFNEHERFEAHLPAIDRESNPGQVNKLLFLASIIWNKPEYESYLSPSTDESEPPYELLKAMFAGIFDSGDNENEKPCDVNYIATLLIDLFKMGYYEQYDGLIQRFPAYYFILANILGDYFYNHNQLQLAIDYYSLLLDKKQLSGPGHYFLSMLYLAQGETVEGLEFLREAIRINPDQGPWYIRYLKASPKTPERATVAKEYEDRFYQNLNIDVVRQLIKGQA